MRLLTLLNELKASELDDMRQMLDSGEDVFGWLKSNGWRKIGERSRNSHVLANPSSPYIIKILKESKMMRGRPEVRCGVQWLRYCNKNWQSNPHLPRVYYVQTAPDPEWRNATMYLAVMERLDEFDVERLYAGMDDRQRAQMAAFMWVLVNALGRDQVMPPNASLGLLDAIERNAKRVAAENADHPLMQAKQAIMKIMAGSGCMDDLHAENVMMRPGSGELVISDPLDEG